MFLCASSLFFASPYAAVSVSSSIPWSVSGLSLSRSLSSAQMDGTSAGGHQWRAEAKKPGSDEPGEVSPPKGKAPVKRAGAKSEAANEVR